MAEPWFFKNPTDEGEYLVCPSYGGMDVWHYYPQLNKWGRYEPKTDLIELNGRKPIRWQHLPDPPKYMTTSRYRNWFLHPEHIKRREQGGKI